MQTKTEGLLSESLSCSTNAIGYRISQELAALYPGRAIIHGAESLFKLEEYTKAGLCAAELKPCLFNQITTDWRGHERGLESSAENAWFQVSWQGYALEVVLASWKDDGFRPCKTRYHWILADDLEVAEEFFRVVCDWNAEVRGEVLVFDMGYWNKSESLFHAIQSVTFDSVVLRGELKEEIQEDFAQFFASREMYEHYRAPWKRGVLFIGPPGNGKTHTVKALVNWLRQPCLYVKSFKQRHGTDHESIQSVFRRARQTTPCILVLEDLDSLVDSGNRSFFLNELDGFASNTGIVVLATTNHPERLDPAILERPSRFDRKYHFELPGPAERLAYISFRNSSLEADLRLREPDLPHVVEAADGFSFAYLKELFLSSMMRWIAAPRAGGMADVMLFQAESLRSQMSSVMEEPAAAAGIEE